VYGYAGETAWTETLFEAAKSSDMFACVAGRAAHGDIDDASSAVPQALPDPVVLRHTFPAVIPSLPAPLAVASRRLLTGCC
jgi:hypothetical protein